MTHDTLNLCQSNSHHGGVGGWTDEKRNPRLTVVDTESWHSEFIVLPSLYFRQKENFKIKSYFFFFYLDHTDV